MVDEHFYLIVAISQSLRDVERPDGTSHEFLGVCMSIKRQSSVGAYALELQEVALPFFLGCGKYLIV